MRLQPWLCIPRPVGPQRLQCSARAPWEGEGGAGDTHLLSEDTSQGWEGQLGLTVSWLCSMPVKRKDCCFPLLPWGTVAMHINQFLEPVSCPLNRERELFLNDKQGHMQETETDSKLCSAEGVNAYHPPLQVRKRRVREATQPVGVRPGQRTAGPSFSCTVRTSGVQTQLCPCDPRQTIKCLCSHFLMSQKGVKISTLFIF